MSPGGSGSQIERFNRKWNTKFDVPSNTGVVSGLEVVETGQKDEGGALLKEEKRTKVRLDDKQEFKELRKEDERADRDLENSVGPVVLEKVLNEDQNNDKDESTKVGGVETYAEGGEKLKDFLLVQIHIKNRDVDENVLAVDVPVLWERR
jgi:hypothetical protein